MKKITDVRIYKKYNEKYNLDKYLHIFYYLFFGVLTTVINIVVYALFAKVFKFNYQLSNIIAWTIAVITAYLTNRKYVFDSSSQKKKNLWEFFKFIIVRILTLLLEIFVMYIGVKVLLIDDLIIKCVSNVVVIITNYIMSRYIVFNSKKKIKNSDILDNRKMANQIFEDNYEYKFNLSFLILYTIAFITLLTDIIIYFFKLEYIFALVISLCITSLVYALLKKKNIIKIKCEFKKYDLIFIVLVLILCASSIVFLDNFWDTKSYHIYLQENPFMDKVNSDFFPGRTLNSFLFPLADRIHYLFRYFLGYRLGTIMSYYLLIVIYYEIKRIIKEILKNDVNELLLSVISILPVMMFTCIEQAGKYYIDNFSIAFLLEIIYIILFKKQILKNRKLMYYLGMLVGIIIGVKVSNAALLIPVFLVFVKNNIKDIKYVKIYDYIVTLLLLIMPFGVYAIDNYIQTGNILYPYYNNVFKSEMFMEESWQDTKFGGKNFLEKILWPYYGIFSPSRLYDYGSVSPMWYIGYSVIIVYGCVYCIKKIIRYIKGRKKENIAMNIEYESVNLHYLVVTTFLLYIVWEFLLGGYVRYAFVIPICAYIVILSILVNMIKKNKKIVVAVFLIAIMYETSYEVYEYFSFYHRSFITYLIDFGIDSAKYQYIQNLSKIFNDKNSEKISLNEGDAWGVLYDDSSIPTMLREGINVPIYNIRKKIYNTSLYGANDKLYQMYQNVMKKARIWVNLNTSDIKLKIEQLNENGYKIEELKLYTDIDTLNIDEDLILARISYDENIDSINNVSEVLNNYAVYDLDKKQDIRIALCYASNTKINFAHDGKVELYILNEEKNEKKKVGETILHLKELYEIELNTTDLSENDKLMIQTYDNVDYRIFIY